MRAGVSHARNIGLANVRGCYVTFVDADDTIEPDYVSILLSTLKETNADVVWANHHEENANGFKMPYFSFPTDSLSVLHDKDMANLFFINDKAVGYVWAKLFKASLIKKHNLLFNVERTIAEDYEFNMEYILSCNSIAIINHPIYNYCLGSLNSLSKKFHINGLRMKLRSLKLLQDINSQFSLGYDDTFFSSQFAPQFFEYFHQAAKQPNNTFTQIIDEVSKESLFKCTLDTTKYKMLTKAYWPAFFLAKYRLFRFLQLYLKHI